MTLPCSLEQHVCGHKAANVSPCMCRGKSYSNSEADLVALEEQTATYRNPVGTPDVPRHLDFLSFPLFLHLGRRMVNCGRFRPLGFRGGCFSSRVLRQQLSVMGIYFIFFFPPKLRTSALPSSFRVSSAFVNLLKLIFLLVCKCKWFFKRLMMRRLAIITIAAPDAARGLELSETCIVPSGRH